jgi:hypothetical protein
MRSIFTALAIASLFFLVRGELRAQTQVTDFKTAVSALRSQIPAERLRGLTFLAKLGTKASAASRDVVSALYDPNDKVRKQAFDTLSAINPDIAPWVSQLIKPSNSGDDLEDKYGAMRELARMGEKGAAAVPAMVAFYRAQPSGPGLLASFSAVGKADPSLAAFFANIAVTAPDTNTREAAMTALSKQRDQSGGLEVLNKALAGDDVKQKVRLVGNLAELAKTNENAQRMLEAAMRGGQPAEVQEAARKALQNLRR